MFTFQSIEKLKQDDIDNDAKHMEKIANKRSLLMKKVRNIYNTGQKFRGTSHFCRQMVFVSTSPLLPPPKHFEGGWEKCNKKLKK